MVFILSPKNIQWKVVTALSVAIVASVAMQNLAKQKGEGGKTRSPKTQMPQLPSSQTPPAVTTGQLTTPPPAGWKKMAGNSVELWLPAGYEGGNPSQDLEGNKKLTALNPDYQKVIEAIRLNPTLALAAFELQNPQPGFVTNVNILPEKVADGTRVEQYLPTAIQEISSQYQVIDQKVVFLNQAQAVRLVVELNAGNTKVKQLLYAIPKGNIFWLVTYSSSAQEFEQRLPTFERSIRTFSVNYRDQPHG